MNAHPNLWKNRARNLNQRGRVFQADGHLSPADLRFIVARDRSRCVYCECDLDYETPDNVASFDHIIRLADGGSNTPANVVCACRECNQRNNKRSSKDPTEAALERLRWYLARKTDSRLAA